MSNPSFTINSRHIRAPLNKSYIRPRIPSNQPIHTNIKGFHPNKWNNWTTTRPLISSIASKLLGYKFGIDNIDVCDRALLIQSTTHYKFLRDANLTLKHSIPDTFQGGDWAENLNVSGTANCKTLCIGDILTTPNSKLQLQITSPRRPCSKIDVLVGKTWNGQGVRAFCAKTGTSGFFVRILIPGIMNDGDVFTVSQRMHPKYTLEKVSFLLYGMQGACNKANGYALPGKGTKHGKTAHNALGGGSTLVQKMFQGTLEELKELAAMKEMASYEWQEEFQAMLNEIQNSTAIQSSTISTVSSKRWFILFLWWITHALVGGCARIIYELNIPDIINMKEFALTSIDLPFLFQAGTITTLVAKLLSGPFSSYFGSYHIGWLSLLSLGVLFICTGNKYVSFFVSWNLMRFFQAATWPATNQLLEDWFPSSEHGQAWGIMSTASRVGIMVVTACLATFSTTVNRTHVHVGSNFTSVGIVMLLFCGVLIVLLKNKPKEDTKTATKTATKKDKTVRTTSMCSELMASTIQQPTFIIALFIQATVCPIAEFQSQVPLWLTADDTLTSNEISTGTTLWHFGILCSVVAAGYMFDRGTELQRGLILALPVLMNSVLFRILPNMSNGKYKIIASFVLGFGFAPANYLCMSTWTMRHSKRNVMPIVSSVIDLAGYAGTIGILQLSSSSLNDESGGGESEQDDSLNNMMHLLSISAMLCCVAVVVLFVYEHVHQKVVVKKDLKRE